MNDQFVKLKIKKLPIDEYTTLQYVNKKILNYAHEHKIAGLPPKDFLKLGLDTDLFVKFHWYKGPLAQSVRWYIVDKNGKPKWVYGVFVS